MTGAYCARCDSEWCTCGNAADTGFLALSQASDNQPDLSTASDKSEPEPVTLDAPRLSDVVRERVEWLWKGRLARGKLSILDGDPSLGKSTLVVDLVARLSTCSPLPDGSRLDAPISTILLSAEDGIADTIVPRLQAAQGDLSRVRAVRSVVEDDKPRPVSLPRDLDLIEKLIGQDQAQVVVFDPLMAFLSGNVDSHRDQDVRLVLHAVAAMIERQKVAGLILRHLNKAPGGNPLYRGGGSIGIIGAARVGMIVAPDPADENRVVFASSKSNLTRKPDSLAYRLVTDEEHDVAVVKWQGVSALSADAILNPARETAVDRAESFLENLLAEGPVLQSEVKTRARAEGHSWASMRRAKDALGAESVRQNVEGEPRGSGAWYWSITGEMSTLNKPQNPSPASNNGSSKVLKSSDGSEYGVPDLHEQAEAVRSWNAAIPAMTLDEIPWAK